MKALYNINYSGVCTEYYKSNNSGKRKNDDYERNNSIKQNGLMGVTRAQAKKIKNIGHYLSYNNRIYKGKLKFLTLTLPTLKGVPFKDWEITEQLSKWLENMKKQGYIKSYIWTAEKQKNGNIHYHIIAETKYIPIQKANTAWVNLLNKWCYTSKNAIELTRFRSSGVRKQVDVKNLSKYITKYITKNNGQNRIYSATSGITHNWNKLASNLSITEQSTLNFITSELEKIDIPNITEFSVYIAKNKENHYQNFNRILKRKKIPVLTNINPFTNFEKQKE